MNKINEESKKEVKQSSLFKKIQDFLKRKEKSRKEVIIGKYKYYIK
jgi:hypothetical protein